MNEISYSLLLRELAERYYDQRIEFGEYRARRKEILDSIDKEFNHAQSRREPRQNVDDTTDFIQTVGFIAGSEVDQ